MSAQVGSGSAHPYTCNTCQVAFRTSDLQRSHMQSDWHRYNLKRRVASLPPLTSEIFAEKVLANKASAAATAARASFEKHCSACQKAYYSENAYVNHLGSAKHRANLARQPASSIAPEDDRQSMISSTFSLGEPIQHAANKVDEDAEAEFDNVVDGLKQASLAEPDMPGRRPSRPHHSAADEHKTEHPLSPTATGSSDATMEEGSTTTTNKEDTLLTCLFCNFRSPTFALNIQHMTKFHGMFIPETEYLVDLEGLVEYLYEKINSTHECLYCGKLKHTTSGIQTHMRDRGHCMIAFSSEEEMLEIGHFYDFRATYSDDEDDEDSDTEGEEENKGGVKLGAKRSSAPVDGEDEDMADAEGWETDSTLSSVPTDEITSIPIDRTHSFTRLDKHKHHSHSDPRPHKSSDGFHSHAHHTPHAVYHDEYELHLPSGRTAGHRSLAKYYRQNLRNYPTPDERAARQATTEGASASEEDTDPEGTVQRGRGRQGQQQQLVTRGENGLGMVGVSDAKKREARAVEKREKKREQRAQAKQQWGVNKKGNSQKHFRDPLLQ